VVRDEAEQRLLEVRAGDRQAVDQARADRRRERDAELRRGHRAGHGPEHLAAALDVVPVGEQRVARGARVEVLVVRRNARVRALFGDRDVEPR
jgi:hypothetical protein